MDDFERRINKPKRWREYESHGRISYVEKKASREWITLYQHTGIALQVNPAYGDYRLWIFTQYGNVAVDLDKTKSSEFMKALGVFRHLTGQRSMIVDKLAPTVLHKSRTNETLLISNREQASFPSRSRIDVKYTVGERRYITAHVRDAFVRRRKRKPNIASKV